MANFQLIFKDIYFDYRVSVNVCELENDEGVKRDCINIEVFDENDNEIADIIFDKSTAIKFAKTVRTEINKIQEGGENV